MITVRLYGHLAKKFGKVFRLSVRTPREAISALSANFSDFKSHVLEFGGNGYYVTVDKKDRDAEGLEYPVEKEIRIAPAVTGASAGVRIVVGALLVVAGVIINAGTGGAGSFFGNFLIATGVSMIVGGVAEILFPPPKAESVEATENKPGYAFDGPTNTVAQGNPVPICYGRLVVGSQVISASMRAGDIPL